MKSLSAATLFLIAAAATQQRASAFQQQWPSFGRSSSSQLQQRERPTAGTTGQQQFSIPATRPLPSTTTALQAWFFGTDEKVSTTMSGDRPDEMVKVRIERTSSNSRRIAGEITVDDTPLDDVWAILTDYDRLSIHVPNLIESKITSRAAAPPNSEQGDGSFRCRLYQKGAQKIVGFDFSATVTMDMTEYYTTAPDGSAIVKSISFKCVDSPFFSEFDGTWRVKETIAPNGQPQLSVSYTVDVRPKGPVPVAALEWRIREDVPTNLRAVKKAALKEGQAGVLAARNGLPSPQRQIAVGATTYKSAMQQQWDYDETMAKYL
mmetsp:Transcript_25558/g.71436  ORF Transcript_25558/g.71436 Transcript_25558/m.71436 type:complete len:320 (-) Transcript_25558:105-1064(-)|eukprot:CAMPEP_0119563832 /NCGR_PEP_ID=MMETSP1352-20130426/24942_1 /TAXON_ID=265584 /ORGANISM="Stauroneis constricta, Strain CCMP1120" /LENGTH=319 /DNA_ID=CAMNT_0007612509 /DNA_START=158 /DNA_END=1117 /DNA_ORIENTATION=+